ncbi:hypothetical protein GQ43DRAFT_185156 [Delitschia confertaspora ATCC 74209]|uniref:Uncharacterized protein n=1 Tax=Delitschia confertaspora ATCC 74209 TaxID=1513339 RepID=A0A9P4MM51_9PLEO|nr:hypothetical protein GQ43DRAFT_185156 [Delitschia confertaspora ATCC 74209]
MDTGDKFFARRRKGIEKKCCSLLLQRPHVRITIVWQYTTTAGTETSVFRSHPDELLPSIDEMTKCSKLDSDMTMYPVHMHDLAKLPNFRQQIFGWQQGVGLSNEEPPPHVQQKVQSNEGEYCANFNLPLGSSSTAPNPRTLTPQLILSPPGTQTPQRNLTPQRTQTPSSQVQPQLERLEENFGLLDNSTSYLPNDGYNAVSQNYLPPKTRNAKRRRRGTINYTMAPPPNPRPVSQPKKVRGLRLVRSTNDIMQQQSQYQQPQQGNLGARTSSYDTAQASIVNIPRLTRGQARLIQDQTY